MFRHFAVAIILLGISVSAAAAEDALVAVAANFAKAAGDIGAAFTADTGHTITLTSGSTGKLHAQISEGAPFAVLLSADAKTPEKLEQEGKAVGGTRFTYAIGRLTLWSADPALIGADPKAALLAEGTRFIAIANPDLAPYGLAAREALQAMGLWEDVQGKIVMGQNIGQVFSMADTGAAQAAFIASSALDAPGAPVKGSRHDVPQAMFTPIRQDAVLLAAGAENAAARAFVDYLASDKAKGIIRAFGYDVP